MPLTPQSAIQNNFFTFPSIVHMYNVQIWQIWKGWIFLAAQSTIEKENNSNYLNINTILVLQLGEYASLLAKWLQYYIGVVQQIITVLHRVGQANDDGWPQILGY